MMRIGLLFALVVFPAAAADLDYSSKYLKVALSSTHPAFETLAVDSLGKGKLSANLLHAPPAPTTISRSWAVGWGDGCAI